MFQQREELLLLVFLHVVQDAGAGDVLGVHLAGSQIQALLPDLLIHNNTLSQVAGTGSSGALARAGDMAAAELGERGMSPADLLSRLPYAFKETEQG